MEAPNVQGMWFYRQILRIPWLEQVSNEEVFLNALVFEISFKFLGHFMRNGGLENLILTR